MRILLLAILVSFLTGCSAAVVAAPATSVVALQPELSAAVATVTVAGKVTAGAEKTPLPGIRVGAYPLESQHLRGEPPFASALTAEDGLFSLTLPSGRYFFIAEGETLYSFYGRNPVTVTEAGLVGMNLSLVERNPQLSTIKPLVETGVLGHVYADGKPVAGVVVTVYTDLTSQLKGQGLGMTAPTDEAGLFEAPLPPGTYYLIARKRRSGHFMGPLQAGDYFGYFADNPVVVKSGEVARVPLSLIEVPEKVEQLADSMFGETSISGRIVDAAGQPLAGLRVLLYNDSLMLNRPLFVSQPSAADGSYVISFPQGGSYWLAARSQLGGPPLPGQFYGRYLGSPDGSVQVKNGQSLTKIELVAEEMK